MISNLAYVHPDAKIGKNVTIEPFAYIEGDVVIGDDCWIGPHAIIYNGARLGKGNKVHPGACIACLPQDLKFAGEQTTAVIGDYNDIRECVTISRGTVSRGTTVVGDHNLLMAYVHVAHDDVVGSHCVIPYCQIRNIKHLQQSHLYWFPDYVPDGFHLRSYQMSLL